MTPLLEVQDLRKYFTVPAGKLHAVDGVTFTLQKGATLGVVGESGCGKSTLGRTIIRLLEADSGQVLLNGQDITHVRGSALRAAREKMQIIFQDPYSSLNPRKSVNSTILEPLKRSTNNRHIKKILLEEKAKELMTMVGIDNRLRYSYPHELDGGRRQRVGITRALALEPELIVCDEPVSALDVSIQAQVLNLLMDLQDKLGLAYIFVTHDLSVVRHISDDILVMYLGQMVEKSQSKELFKKPLHPYTQALLSAVPSVNLRRQTNRIRIMGELTSPINPKPGCRFAVRCQYASGACQEPQEYKELLPGHFVACCRAEVINT